MPHHLVVGAGPIGSTVAQLLARDGHDVQLLSRSGRGPEDAGITRVIGDAADARAVTRLARGAVAVYNCANPPYHRWAQEWPPMARAMLAAAESSGAVLATVSNLYGYGPVDRAMTEDLPLAATGTKGRVRAQMFADALHAHQSGGVRMTEVRGSDYVGPGAGSHLGERVVPKVLAGKRVSVVGDPDMPHTWTYTRDMARLVVTAAADERAWGRAWHAPSNEPRTQREAVDDLARVAGVPPVPVGSIPATALRALGLVNPTLRELRETMYQFTRPFVMDSEAAQQTFGLQPTPWVDVLSETVRSYSEATTAATA